MKPNFTLAPKLPLFFTLNPKMVTSESQINSVELILDPEHQGVSLNDPSPTISVLWDKAAQQAVIETKVGPTIASRAYGMVHTGMFDAWAAYDETAIATQLGDELQRPEAENTDANKTEAMSYSAYRVLTELFPEQVEIFDGLMLELGFDPNNITTDTTTAAGIGNVTAEALLEFRRQDGSNQENNYADTTDYQPVNTPEQVVDLESWTPEHIPVHNPDAPLQKFLTPHWGEVTPFGLDSGDQLRPEAPEPFLLVDGEVDLEARTITLTDGAVVNISRDLVGTIINPEFIAQAEEVVEISANLTDEQKLIAEFWENGGGTAFPPGTWMTFGQYTSAQNDHSIDQDAKLFFTLGNAVFDAGVATWETKAFYDYTRPVRLVRELGELGLIGEFNEELGGYTIEAWAGPEQGTQTILATEFTTYQTPGSHVSPPFAEYTSGHSAFSASAATILELATGSDSFGGSITFEPGQSRFEPGFTPQQELTLAWDTFSEAADEGGISRLYGGIHFEDGDLNGRTLGQGVATEVFEQAQFYIEGGQEQNILFGSREGDELIGTNEDEKLYGRSGNDTIAGGLGDDQIFGGDGDDILRGDRNQRSPGGAVGGNDTISGGKGNDRIGGKGGNDDLYGDEGDDQLWGDHGDDLLSGGLGNDTVTGGQGNDTFVVAVGQGTDLIADFNIGKDLIGLANGLEFGQLSFNVNGNSTQLVLGDETLAILNGFTGSLTVNDFVAVV
ncbi:MAG: calcium-binding protein [Limnoraphis sp. WC205]|nr:calcium-binding protein [Limnoraphis sp. WC205]